MAEPFQILGKWPEVPRAARQGADGNTCERLPGGLPGAPCLHHPYDERR
jgi:hypothetical protein